MRLTTDAGLPPDARAALTREVDDIWRRDGVRVQWVLSSLGNASSEFALRVFVVRRERATTPAEHQWPVGELLFDRAGTPVAIASIAAAERVLDEATGRHEPARLRDRRLGLILGRTVAHEMGHYLLNTDGHARRGLMRARIDADELADLRRGAFFLDAPAARWIRGGLSRAPTPETRLARFAYGR